MRKSGFIISALLIFSTLCLAQQNETKPDSVQPAIDAATQWLSLTTDGKYAESWEEAAGFFKNAVLKTDWEESLARLLPAYGKLVSRELLSATYKTSLPGAPDGEYVVIKYKTKFEKKAKSIETVTPMKDSDGIWRVSGYFIH